PSVTLFLHDALPIYPEAVMFKGLADCRQTIDDRQHIARHRLELGVTRNGDLELVAEFVDRHPAGDQPGAVLASDDRRIIAGLFLDRKSTRLNSSHVK